MWSYTCEGEKIYILGVLYEIQFHYKHIIEWVVNRLQ